MSDFLDHVVSRSLAPKASVQPRLPSLFEPLPVGELYGVESSGESSEANSESGQPATVSAAASPLPPNVAERLRNLEEIMRSVLPAPRERESHSARTDLGLPIRKIVKLPGEPFPPQPSVFIANPSGEEPVVPKKNERPDIHSDDQIVSSGLISQQADAPDLSDRSTTAPTIATSAPRVGLRNVERIRASAPAVNRRSEARQKSDESEAIPSPPSAPCVEWLNVERNLVSAPPVNRRSEARQKSDESEAVPSPPSTTRRTSSTAIKNSDRNPPPIQPLVPSVAKTPVISSEIIASALRNGFRPPPPTIRVTIGRVEVRATPRPSERHQTAPLKGPKLSLDDYLRSRGEGNK
jgi:hypothetical protein